MNARMANNMSTTPPIEAAIPAIAPVESPLCEAVAGGVGDTDAEDVVDEGRENCGGNLGIVGLNETADASKWTR
jgi:hypothetical protein